MTESLPPVVAHTREHRLPDGELRLLGAWASVTGAMTRVELGGQRVLVDCGVAQGEEARGFQFDRAALDVDAVLLTHGHNDHVGSLPTLLEGGYRGPIYGTPATLHVVEAVLEDGLGLRGLGRRDAQRVVRALGELWRPLSCDCREPLGPRLDVYYREAGHILGSASVELVSAQSRVICSGDLGRPNSPLLRDYHSSWSDSRPVDLVLMEATYGDAEHRQSHGDVEAQLERVIHRAVEQRGHVLIPAFAIGRRQTLLYYLNTLVESGRVPSLPVAVDSPMGLNITETYSDFSRLFDREALDQIARGDDPLDFQDLFAVRRHGDSLRLADVPGPMLIIASSGMCTGGRIVAHLQRLLPREQTTVLFVGYQARGTPGRAIQQAAARHESVWLDGERVRVAAQVETLSGLSAHADRRELARWLRAIPQVRRVALHHGEVNAQESFVRWWESGAE